MALDTLTPLLKLSKMLHSNVQHFLFGPPVMEGLLRFDFSKNRQFSSTQQTKTRNIIVINEHQFAQGGPAMTPKEELKELILSLTPEQLESAVTVFQEYFSKKPAEQQPQFQKVQIQDQEVAS